MRVVQMNGINGHLPSFHIDDGTVDADRIQRSAFHNGITAEDASVFTGTCIIQQTFSAQAAAQAVSKVYAMIIPHFTQRDYIGTMGRDFVCDCLESTVYLRSVLPDIKLQHFQLLAGIRICPKPCRQQAKQK